MTNENLEAPKPQGAVAVACTDLLAAAWREYQDLYRRDVPVAEIEAAYRKWKTLAGDGEGAQAANDRGQAQPPTATVPDRKNA
jgi:hypothetical protein